MKWKFLLGLPLALILLSCSMEDNSGRRKLYGVYSELSPLPGRTQLIFLEGNMVIKKQAGSLEEDEYHYQILKDKIILSPKQDRIRRINSILKLSQILNLKWKIFLPEILKMGKV